MSGAWVLVGGESLVDLVIAPDASVTAELGGGPYNVARACARLGVPVAFLGSLSHDRFGSRLAAGLEASGVDLRWAQRTESPTTLAAAELDDAGAASYRFYLDGTSAPGFTAPAALPVPVAALVVGTLGLVLEPMATTLEAVVAAVDPAAVVALDPNCRPRVIDDRRAYLARLERVLARADVVKVSDDDLAYIDPDRDAHAAATELLRHGPATVLLTAGGRGTSVVSRHGVHHVPAVAVDVVDTIGAGDTFVGAFIASWTAAGLGRGELDDPEAVRNATAFANRAAAFVCGRRGADPPWRADLPTPA